jgi:hypothetical protein
MTIINNLYPNQKLNNINKNQNLINLSGKELKKVNLRLRNKIQFKEEVEELENDL